MKNIHFVCWSCCKVYNMTKKQLEDRAKKYAEDKESCMYCEDCVEREMQIINKEPK